MKKLIILFSLTFLALMQIQAQEKVVRGTVTDMMDDFTLPGVNITIKGTTQGTVTDNRGNYEIRVNRGDTLVFSFIGMNPEIVVVDDRQTIDVAMAAEISALQEYVVEVSAIARDRQTPVAVSTISAEVIVEKLGSQEFPEILKSTPSVYATRDGGGFGDGRINMRGFDSNNIGVLINGVPVNDMENGRVYWSNWAGLSDVTETMQVQRGLGASRLALSSVGGTINIITQTTEARKGGVVSHGFGNDGYQRSSISLSTGNLDNGWAVTALGGRTKGQGFVDGTDFDAWSYFLNVSNRVNQDHILSFTIFGAPQWHNQRWPRSLVQTYRDHPSGIKYNPSMAMYQGEQYSTGFNQYHKPQMSLNHFWALGSNTTLSTAAYASIASGGGRRTLGERSDWLQLDRNTGLPSETTLTTPNGLIDMDEASRLNSLSETGSQAIIANSVNAHDWYGLLSTLQHEIFELKLTGGLDLRYYKGYHYQEIVDLLGGTHYEDVSRRADGTSTSRNINRSTSARLREGDKISYHNLGEVAWGGLFAQAEYVTPVYSAFISTTASNSSYRRTDYFNHLDSDPGQQTDWVDFFAYSVKGGANYNINPNHNVFVNGGYFTRAPFFRWAFVGHTNNINHDVKHEQVISSEVGYGYRARFGAANVILYRTEWLDRALVRPLGQGIVANITGLNALHQGLEVDFTLRPTSKMQITGMFSYGDWTWTDDLNAEVYDENQELVDVIEVYAGGLMVGNSAQTTAAVGFNYEVLPGLRLGFDANHYDRLWADFNVEERGDVDDIGINSWQMPAYQLMDFNVRYRFKIAGLDATLITNINNVFDTEVIRDATDGRSFGPDTALVYYGWGRSWTTSFRIRF